MLGSSAGNTISISHEGSGWVVRDPTGVALATKDDGTCAVTGADEIRCRGPARLSALVVNGGFPKDPTGFEGGDRVVIAPSAAATPAFLNGGWDGRDVLRAAAADDQLEGGRGNDPDELFGGGGSDGLIADGKGDLLVGGAGADLLITDDACAGTFFRGGPGDDNASFFSG